MLLPFVWDVTRSANDHGDSSAVRHSFTAPLLLYLLNCQYKNKYIVFCVRVHCTEPSSEIVVFENFLGEGSKRTTLVMALEHPTREIHIMVLVHGIMGNHQELAYVKEALERELSVFIPPDSSTSDKFLVHAATCNDQNSLDGIEAGGRRLANEINDIIKNLLMEEEVDGIDDPSIISLSILGNSLGGLYARYALAFIDWNLSASQGQYDQQNRQEAAKFTNMTVIPKLFVTTATPHLGIRDMTYWNIPRVLYPVGAWHMKQSGYDLFRYTDVIKRLCMDEVFLRPLARFRNRLAYSTAFAIDAAVPTSTAAFLSGSSQVLHVMDEKSMSIPPRTGDTEEDNMLHVNSIFPTVRFQTQRCMTESPVVEELTRAAMSNDDILLFSQRLDSLGWTKIFVDVRSHIPAMWKRGHRAQHWDRILQQSTYTSAELNNIMSTFDWNTLPFGHSFLVASSKNSMYRWFYSGGRPLVDCIAKELVQEMLE